MSVEPSKNEGKKSQKTLFYVERKYCIFNKQSDSIMAGGRKRSMRSSFNPSLLMV